MSDSSNPKTSSVEVNPVLLAAQLRNLAASARALGAARQGVDNLFVNLSTAVLGGLFALFLTTVGLLMSRFNSDVPVAALLIVWIMFIPVNLYGVRMSRIWNQQKRHYLIRAKEAVRQVRCFEKKHELESPCEEGEENVIKALKADGLNGNPRTRHESLPTAFRIAHIASAILISTILSLIWVVQ